MEGDVCVETVLGSTILFRKKEAFSDGVSSLTRSWYTIIQDYISNDIKIQVLIASNKDNDLTDEQKYYKCI